MPAEPNVVDALTRTLVRACRELGESGQPHQAGRIAADAWATLHRTHARQAQHLDGAMHYVARLEQHHEQTSTATSSPPRKSAPTRKETPMAGNNQVLDVRTEIPKRRHELIFEWFAGLAPGESYELVNDHDPKPLRYQFDAEHPGEFTWQYLAEGPEVWRVRIGRAGNATADRTVAVWRNWHDAVGQPDNGPAVTELHWSPELRTVLVSLAAGQGLPAHPGPAACFHILDGDGTVTVDQQDIAVSAGATVFAPTGTERSVHTDSAMVFLGSLGDPGSEPEA